jgi:protein-S-isoprenylcysteine O-methyltransferase Ste14
MGDWHALSQRIAFAVFVAIAGFFLWTEHSAHLYGALPAFIVALFTEMYGFPLTIYLLSGWLSQRFPGIDFLSHDGGHLLEVMLGWKANPHFGPLVAMYARLARREEADMAAEFGNAYLRYASRTPRFVPRWSSRRPVPGQR